MTEKEELLVALYRPRPAPRSEVDLGEPEVIKRDQGWAIRRGEIESPPAFKTKKEALAAIGSE